MKALEKDRRRRYETANDFAADVMRYLTDQPVEACPPSAWYRFGKFARRNRAALTTAGLGGGAWLGTAVSTWQAILARRAEQAPQSAADTQAFSDFLVNDMLAVARPEGVQGGLGVDVTVAQALEAAEATLGQRFASGRWPRRTVRVTIGKTCRDLGEFAAAAAPATRPWNSPRQDRRSSRPATLGLGNSLAADGITGPPRRALYATAGRDLQIQGESARDELAS